MARWDVRDGPEELDAGLREIAKLARTTKTGALVMALRVGIPAVCRMLAGEVPEPIRKSEKPVRVAKVDEAPDPRHGAVVEVIKAGYRGKFRSECTWDGSEGKVLKDLLKANPTWTVEQVAGMVRNRFASIGVTGDRPRVWLGNLSSWVGGPQDRFKLAGDARQQELYRKPPPMVDALAIKRGQEAEARRKGEIE